MSNGYPTFIVGGAYRKKDGQFLVQKRSWDMLRIFSDHMACPVFGMARQPDNETLEYPLPQGLNVISIPQGTRVVDIFLGSGLSDEIKKTINSCYAVYLRLPLWACWEIFLYAKKKNKKIITSCHGDWAQTYRKRSAGMIKKCIFLALAKYVDHITKKIASHSEALFCVGQSLADMYGKYAKKSVVFANFLHSENDIAQPHPVCAGQPYKILFVGGLKERKGLKYLVEAVKNLTEKGISVKLAIIGSGSLEHQLREYSSKLGLNEIVEFVKYIQHGPDLMRVYRDSDVFVLPSISSEGMPKVVMEAMTQGVPVVATDTGSTKYLLGNGKYGIVVPPADSIGLSSAIERIIRKPDLRSKFIEDGFELARKSTLQVQMAIVKAGLEVSVPEILGKQAY